MNERDQTDYAELVRGESGPIRAIPEDAVDRYLIRRHSEIVTGMDLYFARMARRVWLDLILGSGLLVLSGQDASRVSREPLTEPIPY